MDLFEQHQTLPQEVQEVLEKYSNEENDYNTCEELIKDLNNIGYTCDYGLDGVPFDLQKIK